MFTFAMATEKKTCLIIKIYLLVFLLRLVQMRLVFAEIFILL